jgi:TRAP-type C4-dicarboxylate transport system permease large subunit
LTSAKTSKPESSATKPPAPTLFDKLYWLRIGLGVIAGVSAKVIFGADYYNGLLMGIIFYLGSYYLARYLWFRHLDKQFLGKIYSTGVGGYALLFLFTWILLFTLLPA